MQLDHSFNMVQTDEYRRHVPADLRPAHRGDTGGGPGRLNMSCSRRDAVEVETVDHGRHHQQEGGVHREPHRGGHSDAVGQELAGTQAQVNKDSIKIDMVIKFPKKEKKKKVVEKRSQGSLLSSTFAEQKFPEPVYFQNVDCVGLPNLFSPRECKEVIKFAEAQGFQTQHRHRVMNLSWTDIVDPYFGEAIWNLCGLGWFLRTVVIDGLVPCGLNDVVRVQKYVQGSVFGRHTDQTVQRSDGRVSKYSLRVFLNGSEDEQFEGGLSVFHVPFREDPVVFEPETGLALLYPQGDMCTVQEETEVLFGYKYVLRADVLFCRKELLPEFGR